MTSIIKKSLLPFLTIACILLFVSSCKKEIPHQEENTKQQLEKKNPKSQDVYLFASAQKQDDLEYMNLLDFSELVGQPDIHYDKKMRGDTLEMVLHNIAKPQIIEIMAFGNSGFYNTRALINPLDSIYFHLENGTVTFHKADGPENNFFSKITSPEMQWPNFTGDITTYKKDVVAMRDARKELFDTFIKEHPETSETFKTSVADEMKFEYLYQLVSPRSIKPTVEGAVINNFNNGEGLLSTLRSSRYNSEKEMLNFNTYYDQVTINDFQKPEYVNNDYFKRTLSKMIRHYFAEYDYLNYSKETFLAEKKFIDENLDGELKTFTLGRLIYDYNEKGFGRGAKDMEIMQNAINELLSRTDKPSYTETMHTIQTSMEIIGNSIPDHILDEKLLSTTLDTITLRALLQDTKGNIRAFDFWASWCAPCIKEMKTTKDFKENLAAEYGTDWIYISADEDQEKWLKKTNQLQKYIPKEKHYRFVRPFKSKLLKLLKARKNNKVYVPRYTIINSDNNVALAIAPHPSDSITFKRNIQEIINRR
ncbi:thioredoxin-like domain-containing protein [uncultured Dokdonia sp.]|uniref:TlpA family protein disulfide reductase n=1 Tax=uncultured Dokdonia sp. TaxID=575653 RepID=UPI00260841C6|nr:thioredoxin-like domain-containing protein [uncultured Dokdonia sp.]